MKITVTLLMFFVLFPLSTFAQDYTQWGLPEGAKARLGKGHITGNITYSPDGTRLGVASSIGIWIYDAHTGEELALLTGHTGDVSGVLFSPDGVTLASWSEDKTVRLWDANTGAHLRMLTGHGWDCAHLQAGGLLQACRSVQTVLPLLVGVGMAWCCCGNTTAPPSLHPEALAMLTPTDGRRVIDC